MTGIYSLNQQEDTTAPLWELSFMCRVPQLQTTSLLYLQRVGTVSSGDPAIDRELANQPITTYKPIHEMAELHRDGVVVRLCKREDAKVIYDHIDKHLSAWKTNMGIGLHRVDAPIEDLVALDMFANSIFGFMRYEMKSEEVESPFMRFLNDIAASGPIKSIDVQVTSSPEDLEANLPTRDSFAETFKKSTTPQSLSRWD